YLFKSGQLDEVEQAKERRTLSNERAGVADQGASKPQQTERKSKEQKRAEAEARNRAYAALKKQRRRIAELEKILEIEGQRMDEIMALLADPDFYTNEAVSTDVIAEHAQLKKSMSEHEEEWMLLSEEVEEHLRKEGLA
ncbi:MAG: ABC transporter ATP-binding protein, partial [Coriobacteriia bacterium]|nr:ABC transporter ATP-binding protein [Coriobacteriia bacterium]